MPDFIDRNKDIIEDKIRSNKAASRMYGKDFKDLTDEEQEELESTINK